MNWPLVLTCFLLSQSCILGASRICTFPEEWYGRWFQSGNTDLVVVNGSEITSKGICREMNGDKFLVQDMKLKCYRCIVMHAQHANVLQYKETYCTNEPAEPSLQFQCSILTSDAMLVSLFRFNAAPLPCPIKGPLEFTYTYHDHECNMPPSQAEACTQESRLLLRYQACANVHSSESVDVEMVCLAHWREGSTNYMVARLNSDRNDRKTSDEESYRCFIYTNSSNNTWYLGQSSDAACNGLLSVTEAAKTFKMTQKKLPKYCKYPSWVTDKSWVALDRMASRLLASPYNLTILDQNETRLVCHSAVPIDDHRHNYSMPIDRENQKQFIAKATRDCKNGYVCVMFHRRDEHVIEMQLSEWRQQADDICNSSTFNLTMPYTTFITSDPTTRQCPNLGRYEIVSLFRPPHVDVENLLAADGEQNVANAAEVHDVRVPSTPFPSQCHHGCVHGRLDIGCRAPDRMEFATSCSDEALSEYLCHGTWVENDTAYLVASTDVGRYCLVYSASAATTGSRELSVTGHLASCPRASHRHPVSWQVNLTSYAHCDDISSATTWTLRMQASLLYIVLFGALLARYIAR